MTLGQKQRLFARLAGMLLGEVYARGYEAALNWAFRPPQIAECLADHAGCPNCHAREGAIAVKNSVHCLKLAVDIDLFKDGVFLENTADHQPLGEWWEQQHPLCRWGGRWSDGDHYSMEHEGVK
jgi:hypothetical protein